MCGNRIGSKQSHRRSNLLIGLLLLIIGALLLARQFGAYIPGWVFSWEMILIAVGLFIGARQNFRDLGWILMCAIGVIFLLDDWWPSVPVKNFAWPVIIIGAGLLIMFGAFRRKKEVDQHHNSNALYPVDSQANPAQGADILDVAAVFGSSKRTVFSKNFRGGEVVCIFGGAEINLSQADFNGTISLEVVQIFGGTKLIVPPTWEIRSETAAIMAGVEDKRQLQGPPDPQKTLVLEGTAILGGIEISSY